MGEASEPVPALTVSPESTHDTILADVEKFARTVDTAGVTVHVDARAGRAVGAILDAAKDLPSDLIVLGSRERHGLAIQRLRNCESL